MFENPRRGRQARSITTNVSKILDLKSSSEQIFFRKLSLGAPVLLACVRVFYCYKQCRGARSDGNKLSRAIWLIYTKLILALVGMSFLSLIITPTL